MFAAQDARIAFVDIAEEPSRALVDALAAQGRPAPWWRACDVKDIAALRAAIADAAAAQGDFHVLVNNVANDDRHTLESVTPEYYDDRIAINQRAALFALQAVVPGMKRLGFGSDRQHGLGQLADQERRHALLHGRQVLGERPDARHRSAAGQAPHPGQHRDARLGDDRAPEDVCGSRPRANRTSSATSACPTVCSPRTSRRWCCGSPGMTRACAPRRSSSSTAGGDERSTGTAGVLLERRRTCGSRRCLTQRVRDVLWRHRGP